MHRAILEVQQASSLNTTQSRWKRWSYGSFYVVGRCCCCSGKRKSAAASFVQLEAETSSPLRFLRSFRDHTGTELCGKDSKSEMNYAFRAQFQLTFSTFLIINCLFINRSQSPDKKTLSPQTKTKTTANKWKTHFPSRLKRRSTRHWALRASESKAEKFLHHNSHLRYVLFTSYITISLSIAFAVNTIASPTADGNARRLWYAAAIHRLHFLYFHIEREGGPHLPRSRWRDNQVKIPLTLYNRLVGARIRQSVSIGSSKRITDSDKSFF